ncbi:MAG: hypothetical protein LBB52_07300, partial [Desulfovibrio sp.]|nr:hypothetical protein [Desulfovibrio sp.]
MKDISLIARFYKALAWVDAHSLPGGGIAVSDAKKISYQEVTGYYIPTLLAWGERERATRFGRWLLSVQRGDGAFSGPDDNAPYAFDTGQAVRGLLELARIGAVDCAQGMQKACAWVVSHIRGSGEPCCPDMLQWQGIPAGILLYALEPVRRAAAWLKREDLIATVDRCVAWFLRDPRLTDFTALSHFHAYILEALLDLGHADRCREGMKKALALQLPDRSVPARADISWTCSTGMFQYAGILYKLGEKAKADECFACMAARQNPTGGWYGSYGTGRQYFPDAEISWAVKYFLDAVALRQKLSFTMQAPIFLENIAPEDGRYLLVKNQISRLLDKNGPRPVRVLDAGCGKGRYLARLARESFASRLKLHGCDISEAVLRYV